MRHSCEKTPCWKMGYARCDPLSEKHVVSVSLKFALRCFSVFRLAACSGIFLHYARPHDTSLFGSVNHLKLYRAQYN
uniref:Uncharacterized protein n=1 Tax=Anopheles atroparvus TaxID=41427 RepID=A0AAG5DJM5_ANOAO